MKHTDSILQQLYMSKLPKAQKGFSMLDLIRQTSNEDRSRGDMQTYFPQIAKIKQKPIMDEAIAKAQQIRKQKLAEELSRKAIANQPTLSQAKPDYRTNREKAAQRNEMARAEALQNSPLAQTFGSFTPGGYNPGAGAIGAETFVNMNPLITGPVLSGTRLIGQLKGNNPYGFGESTLGNVMGGIGLLGDALFLKGTAPAGTASQVGKYITTQTPVRNAWKLNPRSFNLPKQIAKENTPVRQIYGDEALESFKQYGPSTQPGVSQYDQFMQFAKMKGDNVLHSGTGETMNIASLGNKYPYPYFSQGSKWYGPNSTMKQLGTERIIVPKQGADLTFYPAGENSVLKNFDDLSQQTIDSYAGRRRILAPFEGFDNPSNFNLYEGKPHWWKGYRKVDIPESPTITSGVDDLGIYSQAGDKKYYTLGEGFGELGSSEQQKAKFINKLSDTEFTDYLSKLSNAEKRKLYGLPAYDIDKSLLNQSKNQLLQLQKSGADYIHPFIRNTSWRNLGDEFRGIMKKWGLEPTSQKDVEKFRKLYINDQFNMLLNSKPMSFGDKATYINNPITLNKDGGPVVDPRGQWAHPGKVTRIPGSDITMQDVPYPVYGVGSNGQEQMMYPGQDYQFGNSEFVDEYPMMQIGGTMLNDKSNNMYFQDGSNLDMYGKGGQMIRRADGSYSRRGLWDNIRANKGSGKKPTKEMLEQERKIKAKEMKYGGINNAGFDALPDYVQANIISNMAYGGMAYPFMQQGGEPDGDMALGQINAAMDKLAKLRQFIQPDSDLEPWVSSKLTMLDHYTDAVSDYMMYNPEAQEMMMQQPEGLPMPEMKNGGGVPERYKNMGFTKVGVKKNSTRPGKKWMVLAKKGDQYKVVHGGYDGMKDFSQHGSEKRKENFWNRMGGKSSSKATDPFSPLYWHKRFGTWQDGGEIPQMKGGGSTFSGNAWYEMGGQPCYECGGMYAEGGMYDCPDQEKDPVTGKCAADVARGREAAAANKAASADMNAWAKQVAAMDKANAKQDAAQYAGQMSFDYDWMGSPVDKAEKKAAMAQYKQFFQQNPNAFVADDTSGFSPEQKYIIASKLKQKASTPMGSKAFQQKFKQDPNFFDLKRLQSDIVPMMGGWDATRNYLFGNKKYGGPAVGAEMDVTPEQLEALRQQGYEFEII